MVDFDIKTTARAVANTFIDFANRDCCLDLTHLKLQKLLYYAFAWYIANEKKPLFDQDIEAWPHGPVVRDIYLAFMRNGRAPITEKCEECTPVEGQLVCKKPTVEDPEILTFLQNFWDQYKNYTPFQLSNATHASGEPWSVIKQGQPLEDKPLIPVGLIRQIFEKKLVDNKVS